LLVGGIEEETMKLACGDYSFPLLPHEHAVELVKTLGMDGIDVGLMGNRSHVRPEHVREDIPGWANRLGERVRGQGLEIADVFVIPWTDFQTMAPNHPDEEQREDAALLFRDMLDLASRLGASGMTILPGVDWEGESHEDSLKRAAEELAWRAEEARAAGVRFSVEPHVGSLVSTPEEAKKLVEMTPGLELTLDYGHFAYQGIPDSDVEPLIQHSRHFHGRGAKEGGLQTTLRENTIDYERVVDMMLESGYEGFFALEYVWVPGDPPGGPYDLTNTDNVSETILLRDLVRTKLAHAGESTEMQA
jgi:sugar phosphate isomerase/epimerase